MSEKQLSQEEILSLLDDESFDVAEIVEEIEKNKGLVFAKKDEKLEEGEAILVSASLHIKKDEKKPSSVLLKFIQNNVVYSEYINIPSKEMVDSKFGIAGTIKKFNRWITTPIGEQGTDYKSHIKTILGIVEFQGLKTTIKKESFIDKVTKEERPWFSPSAYTVVSENSAQESYKAFLKKVNDGKAAKKEADAGLVKPVDETPTMTEEPPF